VTSSRVGTHVAFTLKGIIRMTPQTADDKPLWVSASPRPQAVAGNAPIFNDPRNFLAFLMKVKKGELLSKRRVRVT
jgi:hypothetical protein